MSQYFYLITQVSHFVSACPKLNFIAWIVSERLLKRFNNKIAINFLLSITVMFKIYLL